MLAVAKTHRISIEMFGTGLEEVQEVLKKAFPDMIFSSKADDSDDEAYISSSDSAVFKNISADMTAGDVLLIRRENAGMTQQQLADKTGIAVPNISLMEAGKRPIGAAVAKKLAVALGCGVSDFIRG